MNHPSIGSSTSTTTTTTTSNTNSGSHQVNSTYLDTIHRFRTLCLQVPHFLTQGDVSLIQSTSKQLQWYLTELKKFHTSSITTTPTLSSSSSSSSSTSLSTEKGLERNGSGVGPGPFSSMSPTRSKTFPSTSEPSSVLLQPSFTIEKDMEKEHKQTTLPMATTTTLPFLLDPSSSSSTSTTTSPLPNSALRFRHLAKDQLQIYFSNVFVLDCFLHPETQCVTDLELHAFIPTSCSSSSSLPTSTSTTTMTTTTATPSSSSSSSSVVSSVVNLTSASTHSMSYVVRRLEHLFQHDLIGQSLGFGLLYLHPYQHLYHLPCTQCHRILKNEGVGPYADLVPPLIRWLPPLKTKMTCLHESCVEVTKES